MELQLNLFSFRVPLVDLVIGRPPTFGTLERDCEHYLIGIWKLLVSEQYFLLH